MQAHRFKTDEYDIVLVDTPGFNDTFKTDTEVLMELAKWLEVTYKVNSKLSGIIYLHRIMDVRMEGSAMRNLKMFRKLCGDDPLSNVVITSTFWGMLPDETSTAHEKELCETPDFWGDMIEHGAGVSRYLGTRESAIDVLMSFAKKESVVLDIQKELVDQHIPLAGTAAGYAVNEELAMQEKKHTDELKRLQEEVAQALAEKDVKLEQVLKKEREKTEQRLERIHNDQRVWKQERGEEIRRIEMEHEVRRKRHERETDLKIEKQAKEQESLKDRVVNLQAANDTLRTRNMSDRNIGGKFAQLVGTGLEAYMDPSRIEDAIVDLCELINECCKS